MPNLQPTEPISPVKNQNLFKYLFIASVVILLVVIIAFYFVLNNKINQLSNKQTTEITLVPTQISETNDEVVPTNVPTKTLININSIFDQIYQQIQNQTGIKNLTKENQQKTWWITDDNRNIMVPSNISLNILISSIKNSENMDSININTHRSISKIIENVLLNNGFTLNKTNSSLSESDTKYYDYVQAYEKDNYNCVATSNIADGVMGDAKNQGMYSIFKFSCFDDSQLKVAYDQQLPFLKVLNTDMVISSLKINGDEALLNVSARRTGGIAFMYKTNDQWIIIHQGQDIPSCESLTAKAIPTNHWPNCYYQNGTTKSGTFSIK